jgi:ribonuclease R
MGIRKGEGMALDRATPPASGRGERKGALKPLWACWKALFKAREAREPLDLDLPERRVVLDEKGRILSVAPRERLDAHKLIEDYMIAANVAAAKALEAKKAPVMYRDHEPPSREKLVALKDYLEDLRRRVRAGPGDQAPRPSTTSSTRSARSISAAGDGAGAAHPDPGLLRPGKSGHFGLALGSYAHFTSPIRRYADLLVHRGRWSAPMALGPGGLTEGRGRGDGADRREHLDARTPRDGGRARYDRPLCRGLPAERSRARCSTCASPASQFRLLRDGRGDRRRRAVPVRDLGGEYFRFDEARAR